MKVGIIGLGLIGGSLARDLAALGHDVIGFDRSPATLRAARRAGVISGSIGPDFRELASCDACVIAVPVLDAPKLLARALRHLPASALITDAGSTKRTIVRAAARLGAGGRFVGAHPFAGDHRSGWGASRRGLFAGAPLFLTPTAATTPIALARARRLWRSVGSRPQVMSAAAHDSLMAAASHLPQVVSSTLGGTLARLGVARASLGSGGRDVTRLAGSDPRVWTAILLDNAGALVPMLARYERAIGQAKRALRSRDAAALRTLFRVSGRWSGAR